MKRHYPMVLMVVHTGDSF